MLKEKAAYRWWELAEAGFDTYKYHYMEEEGKFEAVIAAKAWGKKSNLLVFLDMQDGRKIFASVWSQDRYFGLTKMPIGARVRVTFHRLKEDDLIFLRGIEEMQGK